MESDDFELEAIMEIIIEVSTFSNQWEERLAQPQDTPVLTLFG